MSQTTTLILLPETTYTGTIPPAPAGPYDVTGNSQPAASYYLGNRDLQTVNLKLTGATGNVMIDATLASTPTSTDWFNVYALEANAAAAANSAPKIASDASLYTNIEGNFVYIRARIVDFNAGVVNFVKLSY